MIPGDDGILSLYGSGGSAESPTTAESAWLSAAKSGSEEAFARLAVHYGPLLRHMAAQFRASGCAQEDLEQEGLLGLLNAVRSFDEANGASFRTYAYTCARRRMLSFLRRSGRSCAELSLEEEAEFGDGSPIGEVSDPEQVVLAQDDERELDKRLRLLLTPLEYEVLRCHMGGYSYREIAETLHIGSKTVDNALQRIRRKLSP